MNGSEYIELLNTYSDHIAIEDKLRKSFFGAIRKLIEDSNNKIEIEDKVKLYMGRK